MYFNTNIRLLRERKKLTQDAAAKLLGISRSTLNSYENGGVTNPTIEALLKFSKHFRVSVDTLIKMDMRKFTEFQHGELEHGSDTYINGNKLRVLATTIDNSNRENIEVVPLKAKAGYTAGYSDPDFIKKLPTFQLPILFNDKKYRMFQITGDSMLPIPDKSWVIAEYVENWNHIKDGNAYVILTEEDGIVFKVAYNQIRKRKNLLLKSLNIAYQPYEVSLADVREVWKFCNYISSEIPEMNLSTDELALSIVKLEDELKKIKNKIATAPSPSLPLP